MRVLLDENLPRDLAGEISDHDILTVQGLGWAGVRNGDLLRRACGRIDALLTMDRNLERQQATAGLPFGIIVIRAASNRMEHLRPLIAAIGAAVDQAQPGIVQRVPR